jgi:two-component system alkaline phosphatase synthesis response regulator PhoP
MAHRILIVDDEPSIVVPLEFLMKREGYDVVVAEDGQAALDALARSTPDLVILDVMLPKVSGFDVCRQIRGDPRWGGLKILMLTAKGRESEMQKGMELGADAYVTKPFSTRDLVARIRALLGAVR